MGKIKFKVYRFTNNTFGKVTVLFNEEENKLYFNFRNICRILKIDNEYYQNFKVTSSTGYEIENPYTKNIDKFVDWKIINKFLSKGYKIGRWELFDWLTRIVVFLIPDANLIDSIKDCLFIYASRLLDFENMNKTDLKRYLNKKDILCWESPVRKYVDWGWFNTEKYNLYITNWGLKNVEKLLLEDGYRKKKLAKFREFECKEIELNVQN